MVIFCCSYIGEDGKTYGINLPAMDDNYPEYPDTLYYWEFHLDGFKIDGRLIGVIDND